AIHLYVGLGVELPALGMANDNITSAHVFQHRRQHFTRVRTLFCFCRTILTGDTDVRTFEAISDCLYSREDRRYNYITVVCVSNERLQRESSINCLAERLVHFPVSGNYWFAHTGFTRFSG